MVVKRKKKEPVTYKVYVTYLPTGEYYIGHSGKNEKDYEKYFGSSAYIMGLIKESKEAGVPHGFTKETIGVYQKKSHSKAVEHILQWDFRLDPRCINQMWNVRLRLDHLKELVMPEWTPKI